MNTQQRESTRNNSLESSEDTLVVGVLLDDGEARVIWADSRNQALRILAAFRSGALGELRAYVMGAVPESADQAATTQFVGQQLARKATLH